MKKLRMGRSNVIQEEPSRETAPLLLNRWYVFCNDDTNKANYTVGKTVKSTVCDPRVHFFRTYESESFEEARMNSGKNNINVRRCGRGCQCFAIHKSVDVAKQFCVADCITCIYICANQTF